MLIRGCLLNGQSRDRLLKASPYDLAVCVPLDGICHPSTLEPSAEDWDAEELFPVHGPRLYGQLAWVMLSN